MANKPFKSVIGCFLINLELLFYKLFGMHPSFEEYSFRIFLGGNGSIWTTQPHIRGKRKSFRFNNIQVMIEKKRLCDFSI